MNKTSKKLIFSVLLFSLSVPLTSCHFIYDRPEPDWKWDERQYVNYEKIYHIKEEGDKDYYDIDFTKDVFPNGILIDQEGKQYNLKDDRIMENSVGLFMLFSCFFATISLAKLKRFQREDYLR